MAHPASTLDPPAHRARWPRALQAGRGSEPPLALRSGKKGEVMNGWVEGSRVHLSRLSLRSRSISIFIHRPGGATTG